MTAVGECHRRTPVVRTADVAAAMSLDPGGVLIGLTIWTVDRRREGSIGETRYEEILSLVHAIDTVSESGPR